MSFRQAQCIAFRQAYFDRFSTGNASHFEGAKKKFHNIHHSAIEQSGRLTMVAKLVEALTRRIGVGSK